MAIAAGQQGRLGPSLWVLGVGGMTVLVVATAPLLALRAVLAVPYVLALLSGVSKSGSP